MFSSQQNILKYLMSEAKEKKQTAFESGWTVAFDEVCRPEMMPRGGLNHHLFES